MKFNSPPFQAGEMLTERSIRITQELIDEYARMSGDFNPIHVSAEAGAASVFGSTVAHGCIPLEPVIQALLDWTGRDYLPAGTRVTLRYRAPSRPGDTISSRVRQASESFGDAGRAIVLTFDCLNQQGVAVLDGSVEVPA